MEEWIKESKQKSFKGRKMKFYGQIQNKREGG